MSRKRQSSGGVDDLLPLNPIDFHVLLVLLEGERHGYGLVKELRARSNGQIDMLPGNFYTILQRMLRDRLVEDAGEDTEANSPGRPRRLYRITPFGHDVASAEASRLRDLVGQSEIQALADAAKPR